MPFKKGKSGNPTGRRKERHTEEELVEMARTATPRLMRRLIQIAADPKTVPATAVRACELVVERGYGSSFKADKPAVAAPEAKEDANPRIALAAILDRLSAEADQPSPEPQPILDQLEPPKRLPKGTIDRAAPELKPDPYEPGRGERISTARAIAAEDAPRSRSVTADADSPWGETLGNPNTQFGVWD
jgi:hypothetical protein